MALLNNFSRNLKFARQHRKLSQTDLAKRLGLSVSYVSMLERGQRSPPLDTLETIAKALHVRPTDLLKKAA